MALTTQEQTAIRAIIDREGGLQNVLEHVRALHISDRQQAALTDLGTAITVTVSDWAKIGAHVTNASNITLHAILEAIETAAAARNTAILGPLLVALYAAARKHHG